MKKADHNCFSKKIFIEISWEICKKLGGMHTVSASKAKVMSEKFNHLFFAVGPYIPKHAAVEFEETEVCEFLKPIIQALKVMHVPVHFGVWKIPGKPYAILFECPKSKEIYDYDAYFSKKKIDASIKITKEPMYEMFNFGKYAALFMNLIAKHYFPQYELIAHFHEWITTPAMVRLRETHWPGAILFTTHSIAIGRSISTHGYNFHKNLSTLNAEQTAIKKNKYIEHKLEVDAIKMCDIFTTVSNIIAQEAFYIHHRKPDFVIPAVLDMTEINPLRLNKTLRKNIKRKIDAFVTNHFKSYYTLDLNKTLYFFIAARNEVHIKGFDITLQAIMHLNKKLKAKKYSKNIILFIVSEQDVLKTGFHEPALIEYDGDKPPLSSHKIPHPQDDELLKAIKKTKLINAKEDPVKIIYHPYFIKNDLLPFDMPYHHFVLGNDLGVFPSYYEPWGYTPLECLCLGTPAITSNFAGFGDYMEKNHPDHESFGIFVLNRRNNDHKKQIRDLAQLLFHISYYTSEDFWKIKQNMEKIIPSFDWRNVLAPVQDEICRKVKAINKKYKELNDANK